MLQQLQYSGVVEMVRIRRAGYPGRFTYAAFAARFGALCYRDEMAMTAKERAALQPEARRAVYLPHISPISPHISPISPFISLRRAPAGSQVRRTSPLDLLVPPLHSISA